MTPAPTAIRLIETADAAPLAAHLAHDAEQLSRWQPARPEGFATAAHQAERIEGLLAGHGAGGGWPGVILAGDTVIGQVTVSTVLRGPLQKGFLSYWVAAAHQGSGHAGRAVALVLDVMAGELGLWRAEAHTRTENLASHRVLKNNGFSAWGIAHRHIFLNGQWHDEIFWEKTLREGAPPQ
ncbi:GNAT family N-acetyltransferase [Streptomyces odontomachi]|uniref:GNAT family N-acetyltransferase n=1 Tax=Streptomyces odontomachi TaxID=2944940 RepID=UPI0021088827|nr:GNAT family protein [Streptomyces sp. ODS25]